MPLAVLPAVVTLLAAIHAPWAFAQVDPSVNEFFSRVTSGVAAIAGKTGDGATSACLRLFRSLFDEDAFVRGTADTAWQAMTASQQAAYRVAIEGRVAEECVRQNGGATGGSVILVGVRQGDGGDQLVATRGYREDGAATPTTVWRVRAPRSGAALRAVDVTVDGRSALISLRDEASAALARSSGDVNALIAAMGR
jgi:hypothetical protein